MKAYVGAEVKVLDTKADGPGEFEAILSTGTVDRDGEVVVPGAFNPLPDHITLDVDHGLSTSTTVASGQPYYDGDVLKVKGTFSTIGRAQEVRTLVTEGHIRTLSIAFRPTEREVKDGIPHITKGILLNAAFVAVPANPEALVLSSKAGARNSASDLEALQSIHDLTTNLGVDCSAKALSTSAVRIERKTLSGSYEELSASLRSALATLHPEAYYIQVRGTFDGSVVYDVYQDEGVEQYQTSYAKNTDGYDLGTPEQVKVEEVVSTNQVGTDATETESPEGSAETDSADAQAAKGLAQLSMWRAVVEAYRN